MSRRTWSHQRWSPYNVERMSTCTSSIERSLQDTSPIQYSQPSLTKYCDYTRSFLQRRNMKWCTPWIQTLRAWNERVVPWMAQKLSKRSKNNTSMNSTTTRRRSSVVGIAWRGMARYEPAVARNNGRRWSHRIATHSMGSRAFTLRVVYRGK